MYVPKYLIYYVPKIYRFRVIKTSILLFILSIGFLY